MTGIPPRRLRGQKGDRMEYTGSHYVGEIVQYRSHECEVVDVWSDDGRNGITIVPTGAYGFPIDLYDDEL